MPAQVVKLRGAGISGTPRRSSGGPGDTIDDRPTIRIVEGDFKRMVEQATSALTRDEYVYQRAGDLVALTKEPDLLQELEAGRTNDVLTAPGAPVLRKLNVASLRVRLATVAKWEKWQRPRATGDDGEWVPSHPCRDTTSAVLEATTSGGWPGIRPIRGIIEAPTLAPSGRIISKPGYDRETGYVLIPSIQVPDIGEHPTRERARAALRYLWIELFSDFPYVSLGEAHPRDVDRNERYKKACLVPDAFVGIAALLTMFARPAVCGATPGFVFEAASQGSGKSLQMDVVSMVTVGRSADMRTFPSHDGKVDDPELEKILASCALSNRRMIAFDNVKGTVGGAALEQRMTATDRSSFRVLGRTEEQSLPWSAVMLFSGNNMTMSDDVAQRTVVSRLESSREDPRSRDPSEFRHPQLLEWIRNNRPKLAQACLTILRAASIGQKANAGSWGSFEPWANIVANAIVFAGGPSVLNARPKQDSADAGEGGAHSTLMRCWPEEFLSEGVRSAALVRKAFAEEAAIMKGTSPDDGMGDLRDALRELTETPDNRIPSAIKLGQILRRLRGKWRDNRKLNSSKDGKGFTLWIVQEKENAIIRAEDQTDLPMALPPPTEEQTPEQAMADPAEEWGRE